MPFSKHYPLKKAIFLIIISVLIICGIPSLILFFHYSYIYQKSQDPQYHIFAILQSCQNKEPLKTSYLAELLGLSIDKPINLYQFKTKKAEALLEKNPLIKKVSITKILPGAIHIDYSLRTPVAYLKDYENTAIDEEGYLIPNSPFFTPKKLPEIYLNLSLEKVFGQKVDISKALDLLKHRAFSETRIRLIDLSSANAKSYGKKEIVLILEKEKKRIYLRLNPETYQNDLKNYQKLKDNYLKNFKEDIVIDMRIPKMAFIKKGV